MISFCRQLQGESDGGKLCTGLEDDTSNFSIYMSTIPLVRLGVSIAQPRDILIKTLICLLPTAAASLLASDYCD
jgi:hypothetical protein